MKLLMIMGIGAVGAIGLVGCDTEKTTEDERGLKLTVAPLNIAGIDLACYDILIENAGTPPAPPANQSTVYKFAGGGNDVVVLGNSSMPFPADTGAICSGRYGNGSGGGITYIAPCDASVGADTNPTTLGVQNRVTLWVDGLYKNTGTVPAPVYTDIGTGTWQNPCVGGCSVDFNCVANADTLVDFNFTIMRNAQQGFFDVAVNFDDVFCSAKVDCQYQGGQYIRLVHDRDGDRTLTAVAAVACTGGDFENETGEGKTNLYATNLGIACDNQNSFTNIPVNGQGNLYAPADPRFLGIEQVMVFRGRESLINDATGDDADVMYWNVAVGFTEAFNSTLTAPTITRSGCSLFWSVAASKGPIGDVFAKANVTYPYIRAAVPISGVGGALLCSQHPVNAVNAGGFTTGVSTQYTALGASLPGAFVWHMSQVAGDAVVNPIPAP